MEITVDKIAMIRENYNPKNTSLNLDIDWSVEYMDTDQSDIKYDIVLKSKNHLNLNFKIGGLIRLGDLEEFVQQDCSQIVFHHACSILMEVISSTRQSSYELLNENASSSVNMSAIF